MTTEKRAVLMLAFSQGLFQTGAALVLTVGGLAGLLLAPSRALATLPVATVALGCAAATIPASLLMARFGRRPGFIAGALAGAAGAGLAAAAMATGSFVLLCVGGLLLGFYQACAQFYRFAAAEAASDAFRSRAIAYVLAGGVAAAFAGPNLGALGRELLGAPYAGSFAIAAGLGLAAAVLLGRTPLAPPPQTGAGSAPPRRFAQIARQPRFIAAVCGAATGFGVMVLAMTATPLAMTGHDHTVGEAAFVIQWHVLGMFAPSFFTGWLIRRLGVLPMMLAGVLLLLSHVAIALSGESMLHFVSALVLLGVGWNLLYVGGSTLLTETYRPSERGKVQALNDFAIVGVAALASFSAGALHEGVGWRGLNLTATPLLLAVGAIILWVARRPKGSAAEQTAQ